MEEQRLKFAKMCEEKKELALSFSGCGFLATYHFGVLACLSKNSKDLLKRVKRFAGTSAGSLVAALYVLAPNDSEKGLSEIYDLADEIAMLKLGALTPHFSLNDRVKSIAEKYIPEDISPAQNRLFIAMTKQKTYVNRIVSHFESRDYLIRCLMASCFIPFYSNGIDGHPPTIDGDCYIDGGYTENLIVFNDLSTLTISPFSGNALIAPNDSDALRPIFEWRLHLGSQELLVNVQNFVRGTQALFPPSTNVLKKYYDMGYRDALNFLVQTKLIEREGGTVV